MIVALNIFLIGFLIGFSWTPVLNTAKRIRAKSSKGTQNE